MEKEASTSSRVQLIEEQWTQSLPIMILQILSKCSWVVAGFV